MYHYCLSFVINWIKRHLHAIHAFAAHVKLCAGHYVEQCPFVLHKGAHALPENRIDRVLIKLSGPATHNAFTLVPVVMLLQDMRQAAPYLKLV